MRYVFITAIAFSINFTVPAWAKSHRDTPGIDYTPYGTKRDMTGKSAREKSCTSASYRRNPGKMSRSARAAEIQECMNRR